MILNIIYYYSLLSFIFPSSVSVSVPLHSTTLQYQRPWLETHQLSESEPAQLRPNAVCRMNVSGSSLVVNSTVPRNSLHLHRRSVPDLGLSTTGTIRRLRRVKAVDRMASFLSNNWLSMRLSTGATNFALRDWWHVGTHLQQPSVQ